MQPRCCQCLFCSGAYLASAEDCYWLHGKWDSHVDEDKAAFGVCGAVQNPDCGDSAWVRVQCCKVDLLGRGDN